MYDLLKPITSGVPRFCLHSRLGRIPETVFEHCRLPDTPSGRYVTCIMCTTWHEVQTTWQDVQTTWREVQTTWHEVQTTWREVQTTWHEVQTTWREVQTTWHEVQSTWHEVQWVTKSVSSKWHQRTRQKSTTKTYFFYTKTNYSNVV